MQAPTSIHKVETRHSRIRPARSEGKEANQPTSFSPAAHPPPTNTSGTNSTCANLEWQRSTLCLESCGIPSMCRITHEPTLNGDNQLYAWSLCCASSFALKWYKNDANMQLYGWLAWHCQHETPNRKVDCAESKLLTINFIPRNQLYDWRFCVGPASESNRKVAPWQCF